MTAQPDPKAFDANDRRSRAILEQLQCGSALMQARARGAFGALNEIEAYDGAFCVRQGAAMLGVLLATDTWANAATGALVVNLATRARVTTAFDTAEVLGRERASLGLAMRWRDSVGLNDDRVVTVTIRTDGDTIEAWVLPARLLRAQALGGERVARFSPDGRRLVSPLSAPTPERDFVPPAARTVTIPSASANGVPTVSEFFAANALHAMGITPSIATREVMSTLMGTGASAVWMHLKLPSIGNAVPPAPPRSP